MKVGLCLGGGGSRGYAHIGAIRALTEAGIKIDIVNGTSIGSVMGGMWALYQDVDKITTLVKEAVDSIHVNHFDLFHHQSDGPAFLQHWMTDAVCNIAAISKSIQSNKNTRKALQILFDNHKFSDTTIPFSAVATDIVTGKTVIMKRGKILDAVLASTSIPGIFPPVVRGKKMLVDGFVLSNIPVKELRAQGADFIISIELHEEIKTEHKNGVDLIYAVEAIKQKQFDRWAIDESDFHIVMDMSEFDASHFENYLVAIERGYTTTQAALPILLKKLEKANA